MASIIERNNSFRVRIYRKNLPAISKTFPTKQDAMKWARFIEVQIEQGLYVSESDKYLVRSDISFPEAVEKYLESSTSNKAIKRAEAGILRRIAVRWANKKLNFLEKQDIAQLKDCLHQSGKAASTINHHLNAVSQLFQIAQGEWGLKVQNPVKGIRRMPEPQGRMKRLKPSEQVIFLQYCKKSSLKRLPEIVTFAIETGMRSGEILSMQWQDVDLDNRRVLLRHTKNGESRIVPLSSTAKQILTELYKVDDETFVFPYPHWMVNRRFRDALKEAKKDYQGNANPFENIRFHDLRHEALSRLSDKGLNVIELAHISGHKTLSMLKRYTHPCHETLLNKIDT